MSVLITCHIISQLDSKSSHLQLHVSEMGSSRNRSLCYEVLASVSQILQYIHIHIRSYILCCLTNVTYPLHDLTTGSVYLIVTFQCYLQFKLCLCRLYSLCAYTYIERVLHYFHTGTWKSIWLWKKWNLKLREASISSQNSHMLFLIGRFAYL